MKTRGPLESNIPHGQTLLENEERIKFLMSNNPGVIYTSKADGDFGATFISENIEAQTGYKPEDYLNNPGFWASRIHPDDKERVFDEIKRLFINDHHTHEYRFKCKDEKYHWMRDELKLIRDENGKPKEIIGYWIDITERKNAEKQQIMFAQVLERINKNEEKEDLIHGILGLFKDYTGFESVGIRLRDRDDFPYYVTNGFPSEFVKAERFLCACDQSGELIRDPKGNPILECMCGNVIRGRTDPSKKFFTERGSFWTNSTTELLASTTEDERQSRTRNRCNSEGYESMALIPLTSGVETIGLLQLNDRRKGMLDLEIIEFFEKMSASIGIALERKQGREELKKHRDRLEELVEERTDELKESEKLLASIYENVNDIIFYLDVEGNEKYRFQSVNPAFLKTTGLEVGNILGKLVTEVIPEPSLSLVFSNYRKAIQERKTVQWEEETIYPSGKKIGDVSITPIFNEQGICKNLIGTVHDITERKKAEEELHRSYDKQIALNTILRLSVEDISMEELLKRSLNEVLRIPWLGFKKSGCIFFVEEGSETLVMKVHSNLARPIQEACEKVPFGKCLCGKAAKEQRTICVSHLNEQHEITYENIKAHGHYCVPISLAEKLLGVINVYTEDGHQFDQREEDFLIAVANSLASIIARKMSENSLKEEYKRAEFYNDLMSHDIRNYNQGVMSNLELLLMSENYPDEYKRNTQNALSQVIGSSNLISNLRKLGEMKATESELRSIEILPVFQDAEDRVRTQFPNKRLEIVSNISEKEYKVFANELLTDVFVNLLGNAMKFDRRDVVQVDVCISEDNNDFCKIEIKDNGPGVDDIRKAIVLDRYNFGEPSVSGSGLGLTLVKHIIEGYGGRIWVEDRLEGESDKGSNFVFLIPKGGIE